MTARTPDAEPLLTPAEVATMFRVDPKTVTRWAKAHGTPALAIPKRLLKVAEAPVLGSGKTDYVTLQKMADLDARTV